MRMQAYRMSLSIGRRDGGAPRRSRVRAQPVIAARGDPERPLFVPWDDAVRQGWRRSNAIGRGSAMDYPPRNTSERAAARHRGVRRGHRWAGGAIGATCRAGPHPGSVAAGDDAVAVLAAAVLLYTGYLFVLEPVGSSKRRRSAPGRRSRRPRGARHHRRVRHAGRQASTAWPSNSNRCTATLEAGSPKRLRARGKARTPGNPVRGDQARSAKATTLKELATGFTQRIGRVARADGVALRWSDETNQRYLMWPPRVCRRHGRRGACVKAGECHCGSPRHPACA